MALTFPAADTTPIPSALSRAAAKLRPAGAGAKRRLWLSTARTNQLPPPGTAWDVWFYLAGRSTGKTRSGAEHVAQFARDNPGAEIALVGRTDAEARRVMLNGRSGLLAVLEADEIKSKRESPGDTVLVLTNGSKFYVCGANSPDALRGLNLWAAWLDEMASWTYQQTMWDEIIQPAVRIGPHPHMLITTTPRPTRFIRALLKEQGTIVVRGSTFDNAANLPDQFLARMRRKYDVDEAGRARTRAGRQEINAEILDDIVGALVTQQTLDDSRVVPRYGPDGELFLPDGIKLDGFYREAVVALDPADGTEEGDKQGLALVGLGWDHDLYIEHVEGMRASPSEYLGHAVDLAVQHGATLVVEKNHGGAFLVATLDQVMKDKGAVVPVRIVRASDGKRTRAEPIAPLFERNKLHFIGVHADVEDMLTSWIGAANSKSPDEMDAVVWGVSHFLGHRLAPPADDDGDGGYSFVQGSDDWADDYGSGAYSYG